jgi:hypothetical protein
MTITTKPTRTEGSIGATKTDRRPATGASWEWSAAQINEISDRVVELFDEVGLSDGSEAGSLNERVATLETSGASALAEWNGTDLTQFEAAITSGFTNPALVVETTGGSKTLKFTADAAAAGAYYVRYFSASVPMQSMQGRAWVAPVTRTAGDELFAGLAFGGDGGTPPLVMTVAIGTDNADATAAAFGAANGASPGTGVTWTSGALGQLAFGITWAATAGNAPSYALTSSTQGVDASGYFAGLPGLAGFPAVDGAWVDAAVDKVGIYVWGGNNGATNAVEVQIWDVKFEAR